MNSHIDGETLRALTLEFLREYAKNNRRDQLQWNRVYEGVSHLAKQRLSTGHSFERLADGDAARLKDIVWDLVMERILTPSTPHPLSIGDGWPFLSLTDYGKRIIEATTPVPYDPDGYVAALKKSVPNVSDTVIEYLLEALGTFRTGTYLASAVMLGAASEMVFVELTNALPHVMANAVKQRAAADKMQRGKMKDRISAVIGWCRNHASSLPGTWSGTEQVEDIDKIADLIRRRRNEAGHPEDPPRRPTREQMYSYLVLFPEYCKHLYILMEWASANPGRIT